MNKNKKIYIGIDIGATNAKFGVVDENGKILYRKNFPSKKHTPENLLIKLSNLINIKKYEFLISGIGVGVAGPADFKKGIVYYFVNLKGWDNLNVVNFLKKQTNLPVYLDNDVNVMGLAEKHFGAGKKFKNIVCLTLGSGVGGCIIINNKLYRGSYSVAGELGHIPIYINGYKCKCSGIGCVERYIGNKYIVQRAIDKIDKGHNSKIMELANNDISKITPKIIDIAYRKKDKLAEEIWIETGKFLGVALTGVVNLLNPEAIIIGGGVSKVGDILLNTVEETIQQRAMRIHKQNLKILPAQLGEKAGIIGASLLIKHK